MGECKDVEIHEVKDISKILNMGGSKIADEFLISKLRDSFDKLVEKLDTISKQLEEVIEVMRTDEKRR